MAPGTWARLKKRLHRNHSVPEAAESSHAHENAFQRANAGLSPQTKERPRAENKPQTTSKPIGDEEYGYEVAFRPDGQLYIRRLRPKRRLCAKCSNIPLDFFNVVQSEYDHYESRKELQKSAKSGCHLCTLLDRSLDEGFGDDDVDSEEHGKIELMHHEKRFPFGSKWDYISVLHHQRGSSAGFLAGTGLYLRFEINPVPGRQNTCSSTT
jgi:hypothetical protein